MKTLIKYSTNATLASINPNSLNGKIAFFFRINNEKKEKVAYQYEYDLENSEKKPQVIENEEHDNLSKQAAILIDKHLYDSSFGKKQLSSAIGLSPTQMYRRLKSQTGYTPVAFIRKIRLHKATEMLEYTGLNVSEIAYEVGFNCPNYFSRIFQKEFGISPKLFRQQCRSKINKVVQK